MRQKNTLGLRPVSVCMVHGVCDVCVELVILTVVVHHRVMLMCLSSMSRTVQEIIRDNARSVPPAGVQVYILWCNLYLQGFSYAFIKGTVFGRPEGRRRH